MKKKSLFSTFIQNGIRIYIISYVALPLGYITRMIISNDLNVEEVWVFYSLLGLIGMLSAYSGWGLVEAIKYFIPKFLVKKEYGKIKTIVLFSFLMQVLISFLIAIIIYFTKDRLAISYFKYPQIVELLGVYTWYLFCANIIQLWSSIFFSFQDGISAKILDFSLLFFSLIFTSMVFLLHQGDFLTYAIIPFFSIIIACALWLLIFKKKYYYKFSHAELILEKNFIYQVLSYSSRTFLTLNTNLLLWRIDQQIVLILAWASLAWLYANYISLQNITMMLIMPVSAILTPVMTALIVKKNFSLLKKFVTYVYSYIGLITIVLSIFLFVFGPEIAKILFGSNYLYSWKLLRYYAPFYIFNIFTTLNFTLLASLWKIKQRTLILMGIVPVYIFLNILLIKSIGLYWALISTIVSKILIFILTYKQLDEFAPYLQWSILFKGGGVALILGIWFFMLKNISMVLQLENRRIAFFWLVLYWIWFFGLWTLFHIDIIKQIYKKREYDN